MLAEVTTDWSQFGLAGLVIGALFTVLFLFVKAAISRLEEMDSIHREERQEWRHTFERRDDKLESVLDRLTEAVKELKK